VIFHTRILIAMNYGLKDKFAGYVDACWSCFRGIVITCRNTGKIQRRKQNDKNKGDD